MVPVTRPFRKQAGKNTKKPPIAQPQKRKYAIKSCDENKAANVAVKNCWLHRCPHPVIVRAVLSGSNHENHGAAH